MEPSGIAALGIDLKVLIAQAVNFVILLVVLRIFAYRPLMGLLERRRRMVEEGVQAAQDGKALKAKMEEEREIILRRARAEARETVAQTKQETQALRAKERTKLDEELALARAQAEEQFKVQLVRGRMQLKRELGSLVVAATKKVVGGKVWEQWTQRAAKDAVEKLG